MTALRVGIFVVLGLACLCVGVFLIGNKDFLFNSTYTLKTDFASVNGLIDGADVRVGGMHEGTVKKILLPSQPGGQMTVVMSMRDPTRNLIKKDSVATIETEGILGDKYIEVSFGSAKADAVESGDTIASAKPADMAQQAREVGDEAKQAIGAFRDDMDALQHNFLLKGYFEKRGYNDSAELRKNAISRLPSEAPAKEFDYDAKDLFDKPDNAKLKNKKKLDDAGKYLQDNKFSTAVVASSEAVGDTQQDRTLTLARANVVRDYLVQNFKLDDTRLKTAGLGKTKDASESTSRIVIVVYGVRPSPSSGSTSQ